MAWNLWLFGPLAWVLFSLLYDPVRSNDVDLALLYSNTTNTTTVSTLPLCGNPFVHVQYMTAGMWNHGIGAAASLRTLNNRILKQFLFVMANVEKPRHLINLTSSITMFEQYLNNLTNGGGGIQPAPSQDVLNTLNNIHTLWAQPSTGYKAYAVANMNTVPATKAILDGIRMRSKNVDVLTQRAVQEYMNVADVYNAAIVGLRHDTATMQESTAELIAAQMAALYFPQYTTADKSPILQEMRTSQRLFNDARRGLLDGLNFVGLAATTDRCTLNQMRTVSYLWLNYTATVDNVIRVETTSHNEMALVAATSDELVDECAKATAFYVGTGNGSTANTCTYTISIDGWSFVVDEATKQQTAAQQAARMFVQAAKRVDELNSRVLLANALSTGRQILSLLRYGDYVRKIPSPVTQAAATLYTTTWNLWSQFQSFCEDQIATVDSTSMGVLADLEQQMNSLQSNLESALQLAVDACILAVPDQSVSTSDFSVPGKVLQVSGQQRYLLQAMSTKSVFVALNVNTQINRMGMQQDVLKFNEMNEYLAFGSSLYGLPATTQVCNLQLLKSVQDIWEPFEILIMRVYNGDTSGQLLSEISQAQWSSGTDPLADRITLLVDGYLQGLGTCNQVGKYREWEATIRAAGELRRLTEKIGKEFLLVRHGINASVYSLDLDQSISDFNYYRKQLVRGNTARELLAPTSQGIVNTLLGTTAGATSNLNGIFAQWALLEDMLNVSMGNPFASVNAKVAIINTQSNTLTDKYVIDAFSAMPTVRGARINMSSMQACRIQKIVKDCLDMYYYQQSGLSLVRSISDFETVNTDLINGNGQVGVVGALKVTDEVDIMVLMNQLVQMWTNTFKPKILPFQSYFMSGYLQNRPSLTMVLDMADSARRMIQLVDSASVLYGTATTTTTTALILVFNPSNITRPQWETCLTTIGDLRALSEEIAKEFFMIAIDMQATATRTSLQSNSNLFTLTLTQLVDGSGTTLPPAPTQIIYNQLQIVLTAWNTFRPLLQPVLGGTSTPPTTTQLMQVYNEGSALTSMITVAANRYMDEIQANNVGFDQRQVNTASEQSMYIQRVTKEIMLVSLTTGTEKTTQLTNVDTTRKLFDISHAALLNGLAFVNLPASIRKCSLFQMRAVTYHWNNYTTYIDDILRVSSVNGMQRAVVISQCAALKTQVQVTTAQYVSQSTVCSYSVDEEGWTFVINEASLQQYHTLRAARLFAQVAGQIDALESSNLLFNSINGARASLQQLREGDQAMNIPSPVTEDIAREYGTLWPMFQDFESLLLINIGKNTFASGTLYDLEDQTFALFSKAANAVELGVLECIRLVPDQSVSTSDSSVPGRVLQYTGRQRTLLQKMSFEAVLMGINRNYQTNRANMLADVRDFDQSQEDLTFGNTTLGLPRTTQVCNLQLLKEVQDDWEPFRAMIMQVYNGATSSTQLQAISREQWKNGQDPLAQVLQRLVTGFMDGVGTCNQLVLYREWEAAIRSSAYLGFLAERSMVRNLLAARYIDATTNLQLMTIDITQAEALMKDITRGTVSRELPAPPAQPIVDFMFGTAASATTAATTGMIDAYATYKNMLKAVVCGTTSNCKNTYEDMRAQNVIQVQRSADLTQLYINRAWASMPTVFGARIQLAFVQMTRLQRMMKEALLLAWEVGTTDMETTISQFNYYITILRDGNLQQANLLPQQKIKVTDEPDLVTQIQDTISKWTTVKPQFDTIAGYGKQIPPRRPSENEIQTLFAAAAPVVDSMDRTAVLFGTMTTTTTTQLTMVFDTSNVTFEQWSDGFKLSADLRISVQILFKELIFIQKSSGATRTHHEQLLQLASTTFDSTLETLMYGGGNIHSAPVRPVWDALAAVKNRWTAFKQYLQDTKAMTTISATQLTNGVSHTNDMKDLANQAVEAYADAVNANGIPIDTMQLSTAWRQLSINEEIIKETVFLSVAGFTTAVKNAALVRLREAKQLFSESHTGLLNGLDFVGLPATVSKCTLNEMRTVYFYWDQVETVVADVLRSSQTKESYVLTLPTTAANLGSSMVVAAGMYRTPTTTCPYTVTPDGWGFVVQEASRQQMDAMKAVRLLLQVAKKVDELESKALLPGSLSKARSRLNILRQGLQAQQIPSPVTEAVAQKYGVIWERWVDFQTIAEATQDSINSSSLGTLIDVENLLTTLYTDTTMAVDLTVQECIKQIPDQAVSTSDLSVPGKVLSVAGRQLGLLQTTSTYANLIALGRNVATNENNMRRDIGLFSSSHQKLIFGDVGDALPATTQVCNLQLLKAVQDAWEPFKNLLDDVLTGGATVPILEQLTRMQWDSGVDPMATKVSDSVTGFLDGVGTCSQVLQYREWEAGIRTPAHLRTYSQQIAKEYILTVAGFDPVANNDRLQQTVARCEHLRKEIARGNNTAQIPAPTTQGIVNKTFYELYPEWLNFQAVLNTSQGEDSIPVIDAHSMKMLNMTNNLTDAYMNDAWSTMPTVLGMRINIALNQSMLLQKMIKEALLLKWGIGGTAINSSIDRFEANHAILRDGNGLTTKMGVKATDEIAIVGQMVQVWGAWSIFKPKIEVVAIYGTRGGRPSNSLLQTMLDGIGIVVQEMDTAADMYGMLTTTTTTALILVFDPANITDSEWVKGYEGIGSVRSLSQKMTKDFLFIALKYNMPIYRSNVTADISEFTTTLVDLTDGNPTKGIPFAPVRNFWDRLRDLELKWNLFKNLIQAYVNSDNIAESVVKDVLQRSDTLLTSTENAFQAYKDSMQQHQSSSNVVQLDTAMRQNQLIEKSAKEALILRFTFWTVSERDAELINLESTNKLFYDSHRGILNGLNFVSLPATQDKCRLNAMRQVTHYYNDFSTLIESILRDKIVSHVHVVNVSKRIMPLKNSMDNAANLYLYPSNVCPYLVDPDGFAEVVNFASLQLMHSLKATRLYLQVAKNVDGLNSRALVANSLTQARSSLQTLREGDVISLIPSPVTEAVAQTYGQMWNRWVTYQSLLENTVNSVSSTATGALFDTEQQIVIIESLARQGSTQIVNECIKQIPDQSVSTSDLSVPALVLYTSGLNRALLQKMSMQAVLIGLDRNVNVNKAKLLADVQLFDENHFNLIFGNVTVGLPATTEYCILQSMKAVQDIWEPFRLRILDVALANDRSIGTLTWLTQAQWNNGEDPMAKVLTVAQNGFLNGLGTCSQVISYQEWENAVRTAAELGMLSQRIAKALLLRLLDNYDMSAIAQATDSIHQCSVSQRLLVRGSATLQIPAPPSQNIVTYLFNQVFPDWDYYGTFLNMSIGTMDEIRITSAKFSEKSTQLTNMFVDQAWATMAGVRGTRIRVATDQVMLLEKMLKEAILLHHGIGGSMINGTIQLFDHNRLELIAGNSSVGKYALKNTDETEIFDQMTTVTADWNAFKPKIDTIAFIGTIGGRPTMHQVTNLIADSKTLSDSVSIAARLYGTMTTTTTTALSLVFNPANLSVQDWSNALHLSGELRTWSRKIAKEFLFVAKGIQRSSFQASVTADIGRFAQGLQDLIDGNYVRGIPAAPVQMVYDALQDLRTFWDPFKMQVETQLQLPAISIAHVQDMVIKSDQVENAADTVVTRLADALRANNVAGIDNMQLNTASRQPMLVEEISMQSLYLSFQSIPQAQKDAMMTSLVNSKQLFYDSHRGLLNGLNFVGLAATSDKCTLNLMRTVTDLWKSFETVIDQIIRDNSASAAAVSSILAQSGFLAGNYTAASNQYRIKSTVCSYVIDQDGWSFVIDNAGWQQAYTAKSARLFLQVAKQVDTAESKSLIANALSEGRRVLVTLREGDVAQLIPSPVTQDVATAYYDLWNLWENFQSALDNQVSLPITAQPQHTGLLQDAEREVFELLKKGEVAVELGVLECLRLVPDQTVSTSDTSVPSRPIQLGGRQRTLLQRMSMEANMIALNLNVHTNLQRLDTDIKLFDQTHYDLVFGNPILGLPTTTERCILQNFKQALDMWEPFRALVRNVYNAGVQTSVATLVAISQQQWTNGKDPLADVMQRVVQGFLDGTGICSHTITYREWEAVVRQSSKLLTMIELASKDLLVTLKGVNVSDYETRFMRDVAMFDHSKDQLVLGNTTLTIPSPTSQQVVNKLFQEVFVKWTDYKALTNFSIATPSEVHTRGSVMYAEILGLIDLVVSDAWATDPTVRGKRITLAVEQQTLIQTMLKETVMMSLGIHTNLTLHIQHFDTNHDVLMNGQGVMGTKTYVKKTDELAILQQMSRVTVEWQAFKPRISNIATLHSNHVTEAHLNDIMYRSQPLAFELSIAADLYGTRTTTTTTALNLVFNPQNITNLQWKTGINLAGRLRLLCQKIAKEFFLVAKGHTQYTQTVKTDVTLFKNEMDQLIWGNYAIHVAPAPLRMIYDGLQDVRNAWLTFEVLILNNIDITITHAVLYDVKVQQHNLYEYADQVANRYIDGAKANQAAVNGLRINTANRQLGLSQKMALEVFIIDANINTSATLTVLDRTQQLFGDSHSGILEGLDFVDLQATSEMCTLAQMRTVTYMWEKFQPSIQEVIREQSVNANTFQSIMTANENLLAELNLAVDLYVNPQTHCSTNVSVQGWQDALVEASFQSMSLQKSARLFLQAALGVSLLDSRVLLSNALVNAKASLKLMKEGSQAQGFPSPMTQTIASNYTTQWGTWLDLDALMADNVQSVTNNSNAIISDVEFQSRNLYSQSATTMDLLVLECQKRNLGVQAVRLTTLGRQRTLFQKMSKEAVLLGLGINTVTTRTSMLASVQLCDTSHSEIVHGKYPYIPRITNNCVMQRMKALHDLWLPLKDDIMQVYNGNHSNALLTEISSMQWSNGVDPLAQAVVNALNYIIAGGGTCTQTVNDVQLEAALTHTSDLRMLSQRITKEVAYVAMGVNTSANNLAANASLTEFRQKLERLISGWTADNLPAPVSQASLDSLLRTKDRFHSFEIQVKNYLIVLGGGSLNITNSSNGSRRMSSAIDANQVNAKSLQLLNDAENATAEYVSAAWIADPNVRGARSSLAGRQMMLLERMSKDTALVGIGNAALQGQARNDLTSASNSFVANQNTLLNGNGQTGPGGIMVTDEAAIISQMQSVQNAWAQMQPVVSGVASGGAVTVATVNQVAGQQVAVTAAQANATASYSTVISTTTKSPVDLLVPLPLTGRWLAGDTMRLAATVSQDIINTEQTVLSGYLLTSHFVDDGCTSETAMRAVLQQFAQSDNYVGLGGMGCNGVCSSLAIITSSMWYPTLSYDCNGDALSDSTLYPDFTRLGVQTTLAPEIIHHISQRFGWTEIQIFSEDPAIYRTKAEAYMARFGALGIAATYQSFVNPTYGAANGIMDGVKNGKKRQILVMGSSKFFRRLVCAAVTSNNNGLTWFSVEQLERSWWTIDEQALIDEQAACTGATISTFVQGAMNIAGVGAPPASQANLPLTCYPQHTATTMRALINSYLHSGYTNSSGHTYAGVAHPFDGVVGFAMDGTCAFALAVKHMVENRNYDISTLRSPVSNVYAEMKDYIKNTLDFQGVSGRVTFTGNDNKANVGVTQIRLNESLLVGTATPDGNVTVDWHHGLRNNSWTLAEPDTVDPGFPWVVLPISVAGLFASLALCMGLRRGALESRGKDKGDSSKKNTSASSSNKESEDAVFVEAMQLRVDEGGDNDLRNTAGA